MKRKIIANLLVTLGLFYFAGTAYPQGTNSGTIRGSVTDPNGAVVAPESLET